MTSRRLIVEQLRELGVESGAVLLVHTAFSRIRPVEGGPEGLITALLAAVGDRGTLVMPSMTDDDDTAFDPAATPCRGMGVVADTFWRMAGVLRSDNPHAFAARGPLAVDLLAPHPVDQPHGLESPVGRVYHADGRVLLLGVGHPANTTIHLAENLAGVRYRRPKHVTIGRGRAVCVEYEEIDHCCERFELVDGWLDAASLQRRGQVGSGTGRSMRSADIVDAVVPRLQAEETLFLHPTGMDVECDEARRSLGTRSG